jgi:hypothetical protein
VSGSSLRRQIETYMHGKGWVKHEGGLMPVYKRGDQLLFFAEAVMEQCEAEERASRERSASRQSPVGASLPASEPQRDPSMGDAPTGLYTRYAIGAYRRGIGQWWAVVDACDDDGLAIRTLAGEYGPTESAAIYSALAAAFRGKSNA